MKSNKLTQFLKSELFLAALLFSFNLFLVYNSLFPTLREINLWDEAVYLNTGRALAGGELPSFARNPLIGILYALTYFPFASSYFWLTQSAILGRFILFILMWVSGYWVVREVAHPNKALPFILISQTILSPVLVDIIVNPSDALFAAMSAFALWQFLRFYRLRNVEALVKTSIFVGLSALSRNDGLILFIIFVIATAFLIFKSREKWRLALATVVPFIILVVGYFLVYGMATGDFSLKTSDRSYVAFLQGHSADYQNNDPDCQQKLMKCIVREAESLYGTAEENNSSIFTAIRNNPQAYLSRLGKIIKFIPQNLKEAYGEKVLLTIAIFALLGIYSLLQQKKYALLGLLILWTSYLGIYFLTFFRAGYFRMPYFILYTFVALGMLQMVTFLAKNTTFLFFSTSFALLTILGFYFDIRTLYFTTTLLLIAFWAGHALMQEKFGKEFAIWTIILATFLISGKSFSPPEPHPLGKLPEEEAIVLMQDLFPEDTPILAGAPGGAWAARMKQIEPASPDFASITSPDELHKHLLELDVKAIYVDHYLSNSNEFIWGLIEPHIGNWYETAYIGREGSIRVLLVNP